MSPKISTPTIFFTSFITLLISISISHVQCSNQNIAPTPSSPNYSIIQSTCSDVASIDLNVCLGVLQSTPKVVSAKGLRNISIAIIESGISNSTDTYTYITATLISQTDATRPEVKAAFSACKLAYDEVVERFSYALQGVKGYDYNFPSYELLTASTDCIKFCDGALAELNVKDEVISRGNQVVPVYGLSAFSIVNQLYYQFPVAPPPSG